MFDEGILDIYKKIPSKSIGGKAIEVLQLYSNAWFGEINFSTEEYYSAKQANTKIEKRIRIHQDKSICNKHVIVIDAVQYEVGRTINILEKGIPVTLITLERVTTQYDIT